MGLLALATADHSSDRRQRSAGRRRSLALLRTRVPRAARRRTAAGDSPAGRVDQLAKPQRSSAAGDPPPPRCPAQRRRITSSARRRAGAVGWLLTAAPVPPFGRSDGARSVGGAPGWTRRLPPNAARGADLRRSSSTASHSAHLNRRQGRRPSTGPFAQPGVCQLRPRLSLGWCVPSPVRYPSCPRDALSEIT